MPYKSSLQRKEFESRTNNLIRSAREAKALPASLRDLVFQCGILQTSAAAEEYTKAVFEGWAFTLRNKAMKTDALPPRTQAAWVKDRLLQHFVSFNFDKDERRLLDKLTREAELWRFASGTADIPHYFNGNIVFNKKKYPSEANLKVLFARIGIDDVFARVSKNIKADAELRLIAFNSIRTALAHSNPPQLTFDDIKSNIKNFQSIVRGVDRLLYSHLSKVCGFAIW